MASKTPATSVAFLLITFNLLFFTLVSSNYVPSCSTPPLPSYKNPKPYYPKPKTPPKGHGHKDACPIDTLKLGVCADLLNDLVHLVIGTPPNAQYCCSLIKDLVDLEAAACLCTVVKANVLGLELRVPISLSLMLNQCGRKVPSGFKCE
ncbi:hypothetical protein ACH5RR_040199 [Cinchona calisaya]|uniref:Bifunctional inhibitor/plant lipid transfer protein/seed storage helical domain-containing protein n=1 Tax=Cinchona calisaya TaxID=153742 RepID=A0ABD2XTC8_9GENT